MKKVLALFVVTVLSLSLIACGGKETGTDNNNTVVEDQAANANPEKETATATQIESSAELSTENTEATESLEAAENPEDAFDTSWAGADIEMPFPKPPFEGWEACWENDILYTMELGGLNDQVIIDDSGKTIGYGEDKETLIDYLESLENYGFTVVEIGGIEGYEYEWVAIDHKGNQLKLTCAEGYCWINIHKGN